MTWIELFAPVIARFRPEAEKASWDLAESSQNRSRRAGLVGGWGTTGYGGEFFLSMEQVDDQRGMAESMLQRARRSSSWIDILSLNSGSLDEVERRDDDDDEEEDEEEEGVWANTRSGSSRRLLAKNKKFFFVFFVLGLFVIGWNIF